MEEAQPITSLKKPHDPSLAIEISDATFLWDSSHMLLEKVDADKSSKELSSKSLSGQSAKRMNEASRERDSLEGEDLLGAEKNSTEALKGIQLHVAKVCRQKMMYYALGNVKRSSCLS